MGGTTVGATAGTIVLASLGTAESTSSEPGGIATGATTGAAGTVTGAATGIVSGTTSVVAGGTSVTA